MGNVIRTEDFKHNGHDYQTRAVATDDGVSVRVFSGSTHANHVTYSATWDKAFDLGMATGCSIIDELMRVAKGEITGN